MRLRFRQGREKFAYAIIKPKIQDRGRTRGARQWRLIDHDDFVESMCAGHCPARARLVFACLALRPQKISIQHILDQGRFSRAGNARNGGKNSEWNFDIDVLQVVLSRAGDFDNGGKLPPRFWNRDGLAMCEIIMG